MQQVIFDDAIQPQLGKGQFSRVLPEHVCAQ